MNQTMWEIHPSKACGGRAVLASTGHLGAARTTVEREEPKLPGVTEPTQDSGRWRGSSGEDGCGRLTGSFAQDLLEGRHRGRGLPWDYHEVKSWEP